jgi:Tfp pilus assembly protein PilN
VGILLLITGTSWLAQAVNADRVLTGQIEQAEARQEIMAHQGKMKSHQPSLDAQALQQQIQQANTILQQLALPWNPLFQTLEATPEKDIALLSIQPDVSKHHLRISGEARNLKTLLTYIDHLEASKVLNHVYLTSHEIRTEVTEQPVRFALDANWRVQP